MAATRKELKDAEFHALQQAYGANPELFVEQTHIDDDRILLELGIRIPHKQEFPLGMIKVWPEDFVVEELIDGGMRTIQYEAPNQPINEGTTIYATLVKCNISTFEAVAEIAKQLGIDEKNISFAGLKDKGAITAQKISIRRSTVAAVQHLSSPYYFLKEITCGSGIAERGNLAGNQFTILVRTEQSFFDPEAFSYFAEHFKRAKEQGFANFFYLQRFGASRLRNYEWARRILHGEYEEAVFDFLTFAGERELPYFAALRHSLRSEIPNWNTVYERLASFPLIFEQELQVVAHLRLHPNDYIGALNTIAEQISFWLYAFSSMLFNAKISECLLQGEQPPKELPLFLTREHAVFDLYKPLVEQLGVSYSSFQNLRPFPQVMLRTRTTPTWSHATFHTAQLTKEGIIFEFELGKGQYATTLLSHFFNLVSGFPPEGISRERIDTKAVLGREPLMPLVERFGEVVHARGENLLA